MDFETSKCSYELVLARLEALHLGSGRAGAVTARVARIVLGLDLLRDVSHLLYKRARAEERRGGGGGGGGGR